MKATLVTIVIIIIAVIVLNPVLIAAMQAAGIVTGTTLG